MSSWTSRTAFNDWLSGVACVFHTGAAVLTSTCHSVSTFAGIAFPVLGSACSSQSALSVSIVADATLGKLTFSCWNICITRFPRLKMYPRLYICDLRLRHQQNQPVAHPLTKDMHRGSDARVAQSRRESQRVTVDLARRPRPDRRLGVHPYALGLEVRVQYPTHIAQPKSANGPIPPPSRPLERHSNHFESGSSSSFRARRRTGSVPASRWPCASRGSKRISCACIWCADSLCSVKRFRMAAR